MDILIVLKRSLNDLNSLMQNDNLDLSKTERNKIDCVEAQLEALKNRTEPLFALTWSYGKLLVAKIDQKTISSSTLQTILSTFVKSLSSSVPEQILNDQQNLWKMLLITNNVKSLIKTTSKGRSCLYKTFLSNCFQNMRNSRVCDTMADFVIASRVPCLLEVVDQQLDTLYEILDILLVQLVEPFSDKAQDTVKCVLNSCGWRIADSIREMLNPALVSEVQPLKHFASHQNVYKIIFKLLLINKDLVLGLINNTELCLASGREDRLQGLEFFCRLFGERNIPGIPKPAELYSHLWETFLIQNTSLLEPNELMILAKYTPDILIQPDTSDAWCGLLFFLFQYCLPKKCEIAFVAGITTAVKRDLSLPTKLGPKSLSELIKNFLNPHSEYGRNAVAWQHLMRDLSDIYSDAAKTSVMNLSLLTFHQTSSWILSCLLSTCSALAPCNEKWCMLRKILVKKLVPYNVAENVRMKMYLYLWLNTSLEDWSILHELFLKTKQARATVKSILSITKTKDRLESDKRLLPHYLHRLSQLLQSDTTYEFMMDQFFPVLENIPEAKMLLWNLLFGIGSCSENFQTTARIKTLFGTRSNIDVKALEGLLFYLCEVTFDTSSMKHLIELVDSCVMDDSISSAIGEDRLHIAQTSLRLLSEAIFMEPKLGLNNDVLGFILKWAKFSNGSLHKLALHCLMSLSPFDLGTPRRILGPSYTYFQEKILPHCFYIIGCGSRGQVKMAIRCVAFHSSTSPEHLAQVFHLISDNLNDPNNVIAFARGVSALGHFAAVCPSSLKKRVEEYCVLVLLRPGVIGQILSGETTCGDSVVSDSSNNTWVDWEELPYHVSIKVQALRSVGRCIRYCGSKGSVSKTLDAFQKILSDSGDVMCSFREVDKDRLRCEAAKAVLLIFETPQFYSMISKQWLLLLSNVLTDPRFEVRRTFAEKLVQGLCNYKIRSSKIGRCRGCLPPCMLGLLALLGSNVWMETSESEAIAQTMLKEVCVSRILAFQRTLPPYSVRKRYEKYPNEVLEIIFVAAAPIIAERSLFQWSFSNGSSWKENKDLILSVSECFNFVQRIVCHPETYGGSVSKVYIQNMFDTAKQSIFSTVEPSKTEVYTVVFELLEISLKLYMPEEIDAPTPQVQLPLPFYAEVHDEPINKSVPILSETDINEIQRYSRGARKRRKVVHHQTAQDNGKEGFDETESNAQEDDSPLNSSSGQSLNDEESNAQEDDLPFNSSLGQNLHAQNGEISFNLNQEQRFSAYTLFANMPRAHSTLLTDELQL